MFREGPFGGDYIMGRPHSSVDQPADEFMVECAVRRQGLGSGEVCDCRHDQKEEVLAPPFSLFFLAARPFQHTVSLAAF